VQQMSRTTLICIAAITVKNRKKIEK